MKLLSSIFGVFFAIHFAEAVNTWCCYSYYEDANGWLRFYSKPADWATANRVCEEDGAELASVAKVGTLMLNVVPRKRPASVHAGLAQTWKSDYSYEFKLKLLNYDGSLETIESTEEYPFICYRQNEMIDYNDCGTADNGYDLDNRTGHCYKFVREPATWPVARHICHEHGGDLVVINNEMEAQVVRDIFKRNPEETIPGQSLKNIAFVGVFRNRLKQWVTINGHTLKESGYDRFATGEPNNARGDEFCGTVRVSGRLQDDSCDMALPYICERQTGLLLCPMTKRDERCDVYTY